MPPESPVKTAAPPLINRELSLLAFNRRVLALAQDANVPLLERLRFLCIVSSNLDEFFEIRVAGLREQLRVKAPPPGATLQELRALSLHLCEQTHALVADIYRTIPDFGGFVLKADSEGRLGPSAYGRTHADAANVGQLSAETLRRIACDAGIARAITQGDSQPLDVGRTTRTVPSALWRALVVRDGGCDAPRCDRPPG